MNQPSHIDALPNGTRLAEFEITSLIGVGGFGMVYRAFDSSLNRPVAIKEFMPSSLVARTAGQTVAMRSSADQANFESGLRSFLSEARLLAQFDHPSLVKVFRFWEANGTAYMVMPLYQGMTLKQARTQMRCPPPEEWLRKVVSGMLGALSVLHDSRTMHRDISPDNIFLQDIGPPVLLDLGAARRALGDTTQKYTAILKVNYAPIEQYADAEDMRQGPWTDLYSLGAVVYDCLCNKPPAPATFRIIKDRMVPLQDVARVVATEFGIHYSQPFIDGFSQALQIRPELRPKSTTALAQLLGLDAPPGGLARFDWRAELGDIWVPPGSEPFPVALTQPPETPTVLAEHTIQLSPDTDLGLGLEDLGLQDATVILRSAASSVPTTIIDAQPRASVASGERPPPEPNRAPAPKAARSGAGLKLGALALALALGGGAWWLLRPKPDPDAGIITEMADPRPATPAAISPPPAIPETPNVNAVSSDAGNHVNGASKDTDSTELVRSELDSKPVAAVVVPSKPAIPAPTKKTSAQPKPADVVKSPEVPAAPAPVEAPSPPPTPVAPVVAPAPPVCADAGVLSKTMCLYRECGKPQNATSATCVEYHRAQQERANKQMLP